MKLKPDLIGAQRAGVGRRMGWMAALLSAGASKTGQKAINKLLFDRPDAAKAAGSLIRKRKGLFGSASVPLMLEATQ